MAVTIYKPNIDVIRQQAQQAREAEQKRKEEGDFRWYTIELGDNVMRLLPPTNSRGLIFKRVCSHYFNDSPFQGKIDKKRCLVQTYEDVPNVTCPICDIGDRILAQRPDMKIDRWHRPGSAYYGQVISRKDTDPLPLAKLVRCTGGVKNWVVQQVEHAWGQGIDITDFNAGLDINIVKSEKQTKRGKRTEYKPAIASLMGPTPVLAQLPPNVTLEQAVDRIVNSMYDLDQIWKFPEDEGIAEINKAASDIYTYYMREAYSHPGAQVQVPGTYALPQAVTPQQYTQPPAQGFYQPQPPAQIPPNVSPMTTVQSPQSATPPPAQNVSPQDVAAAATAIAMGQQPQLPSIQPATQSSPTDRPVCWGGSSPREDGGTGYDDESEFCLMCPHELTCMDACKAGAA